MGSKTLLDYVAPITVHVMAAGYSKSYASTSKGSLASALPRISKL